MLQLIACGPRLAGLWLSSCRKRTTRPDFVLACHRMTVSISATCQRCLDTVNLSLRARAQLRIQSSETSRRLLSLINKTAIFSIVIVTRSTSPGVRTFRSAFLMTALVGSSRGCLEGPDFGCTLVLLYIWLLEKSRSAGRFWRGLAASNPSALAYPAREHTHHLWSLQMDIPS